MKMYKYRNLPCSIATSNLIWCVSGVDHNPNNGMAGVLEWCYDEKDAKERLEIMKAYPQFTNLSAERWIDNHDVIHNKTQLLM